jgi:ubiquinone/menaquinone biosynthesis C-methylase UbiE
MQTREGGPNGSSQSEGSRRPDTGKTRDEIAAAYSSEPWWYDVRGFLILTFAYKNSLPHQLRFFGSNMGAKHLEVACGTGTLLELILNWRKRHKLPSVQIVGVDYAESMLAGAIRRFGDSRDLDFRLADVAEMPFDDASFDTANVANAIHCFPNVDLGLQDIFRVLRPGGVMAANVLLFPTGRWPLRHIAERINMWGMKKGILYTPYEYKDVRERISKAGLEIISENISGNCYDVLARKPS